MELKIIDFVKEGNLVKFYLGGVDCQDYWGDDWNDRPYDCNAGEVYDQFVKAEMDIVFPSDYNVCEPCDSYASRVWYSKEDMKNRCVPCIVAHKVTNNWMEDTFERIVVLEDTAKFYFNDVFIIDEDTPYLELPNGGIIIRFVSYD